MPDQQLPERTERIIAHLQDVWQRSHPISTEDLKRIAKFVSGLQEQYKQIGLEKIAEHAVNNMSLHILNLMAIFQQHAEQEEISLDDMKDTLDHILPDTFETLSSLDSKLRIQSLDDVAAITNITASLQVLSSSSTAAEAQSWLYELPALYYQQLLQEKLTTNNYTSTYMPNKPGFSGVPMMDPKTHLVVGSYDGTHSPTFMFGKLKSTSDVKDYSEGGKVILKIEPAA